MRITKKKIAAVVATTTVVALGAGTAFAYFTAGGSGAGGAGVGTTTNWAFGDNGAGPITPLFPGFGSFTYNYTATNTSGGPVQLAEFDVTMDAGPNGWAVAFPGGAELTNCNPAWFAPVTTITEPGFVAGPQVSGAVIDFQVTVTMTESGGNQDACQGKTPKYTFVPSAVVTP